MRIELNDPGVVFNKEEHSYCLNGKQLSGITDMLRRQLYPDEYADIPPAIIKRAAQYGTAVHESIEDFDTNWRHDGSTEVQDYIDLCTDHGLIHERSEYTVTDFSNFASNIDKVFRSSDDTFALADIKTYGAMTPSKLQMARWQLSCLAYLFELTNPEAKVGTLMVMRLRNKQKSDGTFDHIKEIIMVDRIPCEICKALLTAESEGKQFLNPFDIPASYASKEARIRKLLTLKETIENEIGSIKADFLDAMTRMNVQRWDLPEGTRITRKLPTTRSSFNLASFQAANPGLDYDAHMRTSRVAGSISIAL